MIHQGQILKKLVKSDGRNIGQLGKAMGYSRMGLYNICRHSELDPDFVKKASKVLKVDEDVFTTLNSKYLKEKIVSLEKELHLLRDMVELQKEVISNLKKK